MTSEKKGTARKNDPKNQNNLTAIFIYGLVLLLITGGALAYYIDLENKKEIQRQQEIELAEIQKQKEAALKKRKELQELYDTYLNEFTNGLREKAKTYKKTRMILKDIVRPYNFETTKFAKENYNLFKRDIAPSLRIQAADIIESFVVYREKIEADLSDEDGDIQETFMDKWMEMQQEQLTKYVEFFAREEDLIQAYDDLITFYYTHSRLYEIDLEENEFVFKREEDQTKQEKLLRRIESLRKKQD